jgi:serine/threonine protein kinase
MIGCTVNKCIVAMQAAAGEDLSELEVKLGIVNVAQTLLFLHGSCRIAHCNLSPESIILTADGTWKLAGFGFASPIAENGVELCHGTCLSRMQKNGMHVDRETCLAT